MTSREAIERIKDDIEIGYLSTKHDNEKDKYNYLILLKNIEKDLEILEIIKRHCDFSSPLSMDYFIEFFVYNSDEDFEKVKKWLNEN